MHTWTFLLGPNFVCAADTLVLAWLMWRSRLIPRSIAGLGLVGGPLLFVSGTASIVGHRTAHAGDVVSQTRETVTNIRALVAEANRVAGAELFATGRLRYKAYVRRPGDLAAVAHEFAAFEPAASVVYLNADVCRAGLLAEIEAVGDAGPGEPRRT